RAVRLERLADNADRVGELVLRRKHRQQRALNERTVTDLATSGATHHAHLADRVRREVVVMHEPLGVDGRKRVDDLLVTGGSERRDGEHLRLAAGEETGAVRARENADLDRDRPDRLGVAAVRPQALLGHRAPELLLEDRLEGRGDLLREDGAALLDELRDRLGLQVIEAALALRLVRIAQLGPDALL